MKTEKMLQIIGLMLMAALCAMPAHAKPKVAIKHKNYKVRGQNIAEIRQSIYANGLLAANGIAFAANTDYALSWQFKFRQNNSGCSIGSANAKVIITYTMPTLDDINLDETTKNEWNVFYNALKIHEDGHAKRGIKAAEEIEWAMTNALPPSQDCITLAKAANALGDAIANKYHNDNLRYDFETDHGHNQGAFFLAANR